MLRSEPAARITMQHCELVTTSTPRKTARTKHDAAVLHCNAISMMPNVVGLRVAAANATRSKQTEVA
jgi:hypothetical protein